MRRLVLSIPAWVALSGCGDDAGGSGTGTEATSSADTTATSPTTTMTATTMTTEPDTSETSATMTSVADTTTDGESSTTDTGALPCPYTPVEGTPAVGLQLVGSGFDRPVLAVGHPTEPDRLFVVEQGGAVKILEPDAMTAPKDSFLEVAVSCGNAGTIGCETGLLGFAFHPDFPTDPRVYVAYSPNVGGSPPTRVSEFTLADGDPNHVDMGSERVVIEGAQPFGNHNGGMIAFGPDGYLYFGLGDGGNGGDSPQQTGRNTGVILSKLLRIDPNPDGTPNPPYDSCGNVGCDNVSNQDFDYTIPADNPFVDNPAFAPEIYAWGFRNPWRFTFDPQDGTLYMGDVGQNEYEEVNVVAAGADYGWSEMEAFHCFGGADCEIVDSPNAVNADGMTMPIAEYSHDEGCSITGGGVYRSCEVPAWSGLYLYGDYCSGELYSLVWDGTSVMDFGSVLDVGERILGTGWNAYGDVFVTTVDAPINGPIFDGLVYRVAPV